MRSKCSCEVDLVFGFKSCFKRLTETGFEDDSSRRVLTAGCDDHSRRKNVRDIFFISGRFFRSMLSLVNFVLKARHENGFVSTHIILQLKRL